MEKAHKNLVRYITQTDNGPSVDGRCYSHVSLLVIECLHVNRKCIPSI